MRTGVGKIDIKGSGQEDLIGWVVKRIGEVLY